jgi:ribosomal protein L35AE/L33A
MAEHAAGILARAGEKFPLRVDDDGNWLTAAFGREVKQPTRAKLVTEIDRMLRLEKKAVHIPFTFMQSKSNGYLTLAHGVVTGIHGSTGNLLVSWDGGTNGQLSGYGSDVLKRLNPSDEEKLRTLAREAYQASEGLRNFVGQMQIHKGTRGLLDQVNEALKKEGK